MISGLRAVGYTEKLKELGLLSLVTRRTRYDLIQTYKTLEVEGDEFWFKRVNQVSVRTTRQSDDRTRKATPPSEVTSLPKESLMIGTSYPAQLESPKISRYLKEI